MRGDRGTETGENVTLQEGDPRTVGGYRLDGRLGAGGMGVVYRARSLSGRQVAVKVIRPELAEDAGFRARFRREVEAARQVSGAFTAPVVDADAEAAVPWLATLFVPGPSLAQHVAEQGPLTVPEVRRLALGLAEALRDIHRAGLVHRDLKPGNVLLAGDGPRVIDFGIARAADEAPLTSTGLVVGTPPFMAPEQFRHGASGPATDVFSLGSVLVYAATGHSPFEGDNAHSVGFRVVYEEPELSALPATLRPLIDSCLAKEPAQRATVVGLLSALAAEEPGPPGSRQAPARPTGAPDPRTPAPRTPAPPLDEAAPVPPLGEAAPVADHPVPPAAERADEDPADRTPVPVPPHPATAPSPAAPAAAAPRPLRRKVVVATAAVVAVGAAIGLSALAERDRGEGGDAKPTGGAGTAGPTPAALSCPSAGSRFATSGSSLQADLFQHWTQGYAKSCPGSEISFEPTGSGQGVREFAEGTTELALTDGSLRPQEISASATRCAEGSGGKKGKAVQLPLATMPVSVIYHLSGVDSLVLDAKTLAGIYRGEITKWNDSRIAALNPGAKLPATAVKPLFKSLASGTNLTFTQYLAKAAAYDWPEAPDTEMAAEAGIGKQTSEELAEEVAGTEGSLSYVERGQEGGAAKAALDTGAADPVALTPESAAKTVAASRITGEGADLAVDLDHGTSAPGAYPLVQLGYALVCDQGNAPGTLPSLRSFLAYTTGREGQSATAGLGFGPLPPELAAQVRKKAQDLG